MHSHAEHGNERENDMEKIIISPTGKCMRSDAAGAGFYGASRGGRIHEGMDFLCEPGQDVVSPITGRVIRLARPYAQGPYSGVLIQGDKVAVKMFYVDVTERPGDRVEQGEVIGTAQDITQRYNHPDMQPHVHLQIEHADPALFMGE